jgi:hypothetical protein
MFGPGLTHLFKMGYVYAWGVKKSHIRCMEWVKNLIRLIMLMLDPLDFPPIEKIELLCN